MYLLGYDIGTSSIKATLLDAADGKLIASATSPAKEMEIISHNPGWAEQDPAKWWTNVKAATSDILSNSNVSPADIKAIGISYQMHGLVAVDKNQQVLRPSIIWCDSRSVQIGDLPLEQIGDIDDVFDVRQVTDVDHGVQDAIHFGAIAEQAPRAVMQIDAAIVDERELHRHGLARVRTFR